MAGRTDLLWTVLCDEHEGAYDGTTRGPDYVQGQLLAVPNARVRVELAWTCKPRADGVASHMFDHHLHHYTWNNPQTDVMLYYRGRGLSYRVEVTVQPKQEKQEQQNNSRAQPLSYYTSQLSAIPVSPDPMSPSPSPHHRGLTSATSPTSAEINGAPGMPPTAKFLLARPPPAAPVPMLTLRWSAYSWFWHFIAMLQEPPLFLSPLSRRTTPSLGDLFSSLSLSVHCTSPRVELLHEDERVPGRVNVLLLNAESFGVDWAWVAHYDDAGVKRYESQDMACDALHMHGRALVPEQAQDDEDERQREEEKSKWKARTRTKAQLAEAKTRMRLKAYMHQQRQREEGELVNFNDEIGNYCSPFERQPLGYHAEYFMATRVFAYRTHYPAPSATSPLSASSPPLPRRVTSASASASSGLPPSSSFGSSPRESDRPPFDMPMQGGWHGEEWQGLFGELMADKDTPDAMDAIWEGKPYTDEHSHLSRASEHSTSGQKAEETFPFASINPAEEDEDETFLRRHTLSVSGDGSEESERKLVEDAATTRLLLLMGERYAQRGGAKNAHARYHSDGSISYRQHANSDPALMATGSSFFSTLHPHAIPPLPPLPSSQPSFPSIGIGATRGRSAPLLQPRDVSGCSHRMLTINLKLLWSNHVKHSVTQWFEVFTQPYEPPPFVPAAREASMEWRRKGGNDRERGGSNSASTAPLDEVKEEKQVNEAVEQKAQTVAQVYEDEKALAAAEVDEFNHSFSSTHNSTLLDSSRVSLLFTQSISSPPSPESPHSEVRQSALDMLALVREAEAAPLDPSDSALLPSAASPLSTPTRKGSKLDVSERAAAADESFAASNAFQPTWLRSLLRQWKDRREDDNAWLSLFGFDLLRPQITFQSRDTNSRLVLAAASARIDNEGLPIHVQRREKDACTEFVPCGQHQLESFVYFEKKHVATLSDAQAFVCPVDVEGDERIHWVKDTMVRPEEDKTEVREAKGLELTKLAMDYSAPTPTSGARKKGFGAFWSLDAGKETADEAAAVVSSRELTGSGVLRKIVEPCTMHFAMMQQCNIADELQARQLFVCDDANGIVMPLADKPVRRQSTVHTTLSSSQGTTDGDDKDRPLRQCIKLFLPAFSAHLDSNEYFTLLGVVQALFLFSPSAPTSAAPLSGPPSRALTPPPLSKDDFQLLMESVLEAENSMRSAQSSSHRARAQQVRRVVQLFLGKSTWQLSQHSSPFIAAHVNGFCANHTFLDDGSNDNEISIDFLTLQSKLLSPSDPLANLLIPDPDRWMQRDVKRDKMISVRAKLHSPLEPDDERLAGVTVYEHFEVTVFPLVLRFPHDHYVAIRRYFFPDSLHDMSEEEKTRASENFFQLPKKWTVKGSKGRSTTEAVTTRVSSGSGQLPQRDSLSARESPVPSPSNASDMSRAAAPVTRQNGSTQSAHSSPLSSPLHSPTPLPTFSPPRQLYAGHYSPLITSRASVSGSGSNLLNTGSSTASVPADFAPFTRPRFDSRAMLFDNSTAARQRSPSNATQPIPIISKPTKPVAPTARRQRKSSTRSTATATANANAAASVRYFRYVRINHLNFLFSYHGETSLTSLENVRINIAPFIRNKRCWTWRQFVSKLEKHTLLRIFSQADHIIARKMGRKVDDGSGVQSLSQKFMELFTQREEEMDERKLLGFPAKASSQPSAGPAGQGLSVAAADESKSSEGAAGRFFRMPSMSVVHMPQLSLGSVGAMGEELAAKAILLFGSKKEKQKLEKEEKQKEKERKRLLKEQQQQAQKQQQQQQQAMAASLYQAAPMRITPPTSPTIAAANSAMPSPASRPPLPSRPSLTSIQPLPSPSVASPAPTVMSPSSAHSYVHPSGVPTHSLRIDPTAPSALTPLFVSPRAPPDLGMLALLKKRSRPLPTAPAALPSTAILSSLHAQQAGTTNGVLSPSSSPLFSPSYHSALVGGPRTSPPMQPTTLLNGRVFFPPSQPSSLSSSASPSSVSPHASAPASASASTTTFPPSDTPRRPPRPPVGHPALVAVTNGSAARPSPARPSLPSFVRSQLAAHARSKSDISELIFMHAFAEEQQQQQHREDTGGRNANGPAT